MKKRNKLKFRSEEKQQTVKNEDSDFNGSPREDEGFIDAESKRESKAIMSLDDGEDIIHLVKLTPEEKSICSEIIQRGGTDYLRFELGWTAIKIKSFMVKKSVRAELDYLRRAYTQREGIQERTQFFAQIRINSLVPSALRVVARALQGDKTNDTTGDIVRAPSRGQFDAAVEILNRANINGSKYKGEDVLPNIDARSINVTVGEADDNDPIDLSGSESRERVRSFLSNFLTKIDENDGKKKKKRS